MSVLLIILAVLILIIWVVVAIRIFDWLKNQYIQALFAQYNLVMSAFQQIRERLQAESKDTTMLELNDIALGSFDADITKLLEEYKNVSMVVLSNCQLKSLKGLPKWKLAAIDLSDNQLSDECIPSLIKVKTLSQIILRNNQIASLKQTKKLANLQTLTELDLSDNPVAKQQGYRKELFESCPGLQELDGADAEGRELDEDELDEDDFEEQEEDGDEYDDQFEGDELEEWEQESDQPVKKRK